MIKHVIVSVTVLFIFTASLSAGTYSGGSGSLASPYLISAAADMNELGSKPGDWDSYFLMTDDIDMADYNAAQFDVIGTYAVPFSGVFDGNGHDISNFNYVSNELDDIGLFGYVESNSINAEISNLTLINPNIDVPDAFSVGALVGSLEDGTVSNCAVRSGRITGSFEVGGLVGFNNDVISSCFADATVSGDSAVGGLAGSNDDGSGSGSISNSIAVGVVLGIEYVGGLAGGNAGIISRCYSAADVEGQERIGGLSGDNDQGLISNSCALGDVTGDPLGDGDIGGLVGFNYVGLISRCYAAGRVTGNGDVGGLVGNHWFGDYTKSFWDSDINHDVDGIGNDAAANPDIIDESTANMKTAATFSGAGWDFATPIWKITCAGINYPKLDWMQAYAGDITCPDGVDFDDFAILSGQWLLEGPALSADIAPAPDGDEIVDFLDFQAMAENWLQGIY